MLFCLGASSVPKEDEYHFLSEEDDDDDLDDLVDDDGLLIVDHHLMVSNNKNEETNDNCINAEILAVHHQNQCCKLASNTNNTNKNNSPSQIKNIQQLSNNCRRKFHKLSFNSSSSPSPLPHSLKLSKFVVDQIDSSSSSPSTTTIISPPPSSSSSSSTLSLTNQRDVSEIIINDNNNNNLNSITFTNNSVGGAGHNNSNNNLSTAASTFLAKLGPIQLGRKLSQLRNSALNNHNNNSGYSHNNNSNLTTPSTTHLNTSKGTENLQREAIRKSNELGQFNIDNSQRYIRLPPSPHSKQFKNSNKNQLQRSSSPDGGQKVSAKIKQPNKTKQLNRSESFVCNVITGTPAPPPAKKLNDIQSPVSSKIRSCTSSPLSSSTSARFSPIPTALTPPPPLPPHHSKHSNRQTPPPIIVSRGGTKHNHNLTSSSLSPPPPPRPKTDKPTSKHQSNKMTSSTSVSSLNMNRSSSPHLISNMNNNMNNLSQNSHHQLNTMNGINSIQNSIDCRSSPSLICSSTTATTQQPALNQCVNCSATNSGGNPVSAAGGSVGAGGSNDSNNNNNNHHHQQFINKPPRGWLHPDHKLTDIDGPGVTYTVRYIGCLGVNTSMKSLDFQTRSLIAKESINRVCECAGLKTVDKKRRTDKRIAGMLADTPNMEYAGVDANLSITISYLTLTSTETNEILAKHEMPNISFASGGDTDTLDFAAYVAKDSRFERACFVLECEDGRAQEVITTIGQAFELRFNEFLKRNPLSSDRLEHNPSFVSNNNNATNNINGHNQKPISHPTTNNNDNNCQRIEDREYYNDLPGKIPPDIIGNNDGNGFSATGGHIANTSTGKVANTPSAAPRSKKPITSQPTASPNSNHHQQQEQPINLIDLNDDLRPSSTTSPSASSTYNSNLLTKLINDPQYVNCETSDLSQSSLSSTVPDKDPFDMQPFNNALAVAHVSSTPMPSPSSSSSSNIVNGQHNKSTTKINYVPNCDLHKEQWFHGTISRKDSEILVIRDGDFLVRESQQSHGQYVLTGMQGGHRKHLLLVDPEGVVRTKDKTFESVSHLINYHRNNGLPIISSESALILKNPIISNKKN